MRRLHSERRMKIELPRKMVPHKKSRSADKKRQTETRLKLENLLPCAVPKAAIVQL